MVTEIVANLVEPIKGIGAGIGAGLSSMANAIFLSSDGDGTKLSVMGTLVTVFAGCSLAFGLSRWVLNFVTSLGARNR